jgi:hypothetical protein
VSPPWRLGRGSTLLAYRIVIPQFHNDLMAALQHGRGKAQAHAAASFLHKKFKPIGARSGYAIASLFLPGHPIPATLFNGFSSLPAIDCLECFQFLFRVQED